MFFPVASFWSCLSVSFCRLLFYFLLFSLFFFFNYPATTEIYTLSLHDALPISSPSRAPPATGCGSTTCSPTAPPSRWTRSPRSEEHTSELQSLRHLVCRLLLEKKKKKTKK